MQFTAAPTLDRFINTTTYATIYGLLANIAGFLFVGTAFYYNTSSTTQFALTLTVIGVITLVTTYQASYKTARTINLIVQFIDVKDEITITTYRYKFLFFSPIQISVNKANFVIEKGDIPMYVAKLKNNEVYVIKSEQKEFYVFPKHFDDSLIGALANAVIQESEPEYF